MTTCEFILSECRSEVNDLGVPYRYRSPHFLEGGEVYLRA